jgi:polyisoprenoid-binding protein YceI
LLQVLGALALAALVLGSFGALAAVRSRLSITIAEQSGGEARGPDPVALLAEDVAALHADLLALSGGLGEGLQGVHDALDQAAVRRHGELAADVQALRRDLARLEGATAGNEERGRRLAEGLARVEGHLAGWAASGGVGDTEVASGIGTGPIVSAPLEPEPRLEPGSAQPDPLQREPPPPPPAEPVAAEPSPAQSAPGSGRSFLSFQLPSQAFAFDRPQRLEVQASLSRVGFDARSTLHDFSGVTSAVEGTIEACLARPAELCRGKLRVSARTLDTGDRARDEAMREHLGSEEHPELAFEWTAFDPGTVDVQAQSVSGTARGRMTVRGVTRDFAMPVRIAVDESKRVTVEGEAPLDLRDYEVPVPNKLGVISMESEVDVWISLRLRAVGPATVEAGDGR